MGMGLCCKHVYDTFSGSDAVTENNTLRAFAEMGDPLEKELATHSSTPAEMLPRTEEPGGPEPRSGKESDTTEQLSTHTHSVRIAMKKRAPSNTHWTELLQYLLCLTHSWVFCFYKNIYLLCCALFAHAGSSVFVMETLSCSIWDLVA